MSTVRSCRFGGDEAGGGAQKAGGLTGNRAEASQMKETMAMARGCPDGRRDWSAAQRQVVGARMWFAEGSLGVRLLEELVLRAQVGRVREEVRAWRCCVSNERSPGAGKVGKVALPAQRVQVAGAMTMFDDGGRGESVVVFGGKLG